MAAGLPAGALRGVKRLTPATPLRLSDGVTTTSEGVHHLLARVLGRTKDRYRRKRPRVNRRLTFRSQQAIEHLRTNVSPASVMRNLDRLDGTRLKSFSLKHVERSLQRGNPRVAREQCTLTADVKKRDHTGLNRPGFPGDSVVCDGTASHAAL